MLLNLRLAVVIWIFSNEHCQLSCVLAAVGMWQTWLSPNPQDICIDPTLAGEMLNSVSLLGLKVSSVIFSFKKTKFEKWNINFSTFVCTIQVIEMIQVVQSINTQTLNDSSSPLLFLVVLYCSALILCTLMQSERQPKSEVGGQINIKPTWSMTAGQAGTEASTFQRPHTAGIWSMAFRALTEPFFLIFHC